MTAGRLAYFRVGSPVHEAIAELAEAVALPFGPTVELVCALALDITPTQPPARVELVRAAVRMRRRARRGSAA